MLVRFGHNYLLKDDSTLFTLDINELSKGRELPVAHWRLLESVPEAVAWETESLSTSATCDILSMCLSTLFCWRGLRKAVALTLEWGNGDASNPSLRSMTLRWMPRTPCDLWGLSLQSCRNQNDGYVFISRYISIVLVPGVAHPRSIRGCILGRVHRRAKSGLRPQSCTGTLTLYDFSEQYYRLDGVRINLTPVRDMDHFHKT